MYNAIFELDGEDVHWYNLDRITGISREVWDEFTDWSIDKNAHETAEVLRYIYEHGEMPYGV